MGWSPNMVRRGRRWTIDDGAQARHAREKVDIDERVINGPYRNWGVDESSILSTL